MKRFLISASISLFVWFPMIVISIPVVAIMLQTKWDGKTTWFGNYLYGREGNTHTPVNPNKFQQWWFLVVRNPVSNFGKFTLSAGPEDKVWLENKYGFLYGWKNPDSRLPGNRRAFVFRPWLNKE